MGVGAVVVVVVAVGLLALAVLLLRLRNPNPWPAVICAMLTSALCFGVGGDASAESTEPSPATVAAAFVGVLSVAAAIVAMVPRSRERAPSRLPVLMAVGAVVVGAAGLVLSQLVG